MNAPTVIGYVLAGVVLGLVVAIGVGYWLLARMRRALRGPRGEFKA